MTQEKLMPHISKNFAVKFSDSDFEFLTNQITNIETIYGKSRVLSFKMTVRDSIGKKICISIVWHIRQLPRYSDRTNVA